MKTLAIAAMVLAGAAVQAQGQVYKGGDPGVTSPEVVRETKPRYTATAMRERISGSVQLQAVVDTRGTPTHVTVVTSLDTVYGLDTSAVDALKQWRFKPAMRDGKPVPYQVTVELTFTLRDRAFDKTHHDVIAPVVVNQPKPSYTPEAMRARVEGSVTIEGIVEADGTLSSPRVVKGLDSGLDARAVEAFRASVFEPAMRNGRAVAYRVSVEFTFSLRD
ncbi:MAG: energy transducer TonB [Acidobacteriota bacterium]|nr:energy transducer TonB [Acidobacteriota bacterium]